MVKRTALGLVAALALMLGASVAHAGGFQMVTDITGRTPSSIPGQVYGNFVPLHWDARCTPMVFRVNNTQNPVPNPLGTAFLTVTDAKTAIQQAMDQWNQIPTSYIQFQMGADYANAGLRKFDTINEITFRTGAGFAGIASNVPTRLVETSVFADGNDLDGDGDSDVSSSITTCTDLDSDGDLEWPAGTYDGGTVLDMDIVVNTKASNGFRFTITGDVAQLTANINARSTDFVREMVYRLGFGMGLTVSTIPNVNNLTNANDASMYNFTDFDDPLYFLNQRTLEQDDIIAASTLYPEGTAASGPAALQAGDVAFSSVYGKIEGNVTHGDLNLPVLGGDVVGINHSTGDLIDAVYVGNARVSVNTTTLTSTNLPAAEGIVDGKYSLVVPFGTYDLDLEAVDFFPQGVASVGAVASLGGTYGLNAFSEEFWNSTLEAAKEVYPGDSTPVTVSAATPLVSNVNFVTNKVKVVTESGGPNMTDFDFAPGACYAVDFPISQLAAARGGLDLPLTTGIIEGVSADQSQVCVMQQVWLAFGTVSGTTASINLAFPLETKTNFGIQQFERMPWFFERKNLSKKIFDAYRTGAQSHVFLVAKTPNPPSTPNFSNKSNRPAVDLRSDGFVPAGLSYFSTDCVNFTEDPTYFWEMDLHFSEVP
ncbi:MAG: hypothetical protein ABJC13_08915 [Acidobacteriota bacterium]